MLVPPTHVDAHHHVRCLLFLQYTLRFTSQRRGSNMAAFLHLLCGGHVWSAASWPCARNVAVGKLHLSGIVRLASAEFGAGRLQCCSCLDDGGRMAPHTPIGGFARTMCGHPWETDDSEIKRVLVCVVVRQTTLCAYPHFRGNVS